MSGPIILLCPNTVLCGYLSPRVVHLWYAYNEDLPPKDWLTLCVTVMAFRRQPSHTDQVQILILAEAERNETLLHIKVCCLKDNTLCVLAATESKYSEWIKYAGNGAECVIQR
jgi:hypothetical protein